MTRRRRTALIVEDQPFVGMVVSDVLSENGFETVFAYDAEAALELLGRLPDIDALVTKVELQGRMDGIQLAKEVARRRPGIRIVLTTGGQESRLVNAPAGARVLRKPFASDELSSLVSCPALLQDA